MLTSKQDRMILQDLAAQVAEIAALPVQQETIALWKALLVAFAAGVVCAGLGWLRLAVKHGLMNRRYRRMLGDLESEIHQLRNLPLAPEPVTPSDVHAGAADASLPRDPLGRGA